MKQKILSLAFAFVFISMVLSAPAHSESGYKIGPMIAPLSVPHPISFGVETSFPAGEFSAALYASKLSLPLQNNLSLGISSIDVRGRWHPWSGALFLGASLGTQTLSGSGSQSIPVGMFSVPTTVSLDIRSMYITPHFGWLWIWDSGFMMGLEAGVQLPFAPSSSLEVTITDPTMAALLDQTKQTAEYRKMESDLETAANRVGRLVFPHFSVLKLGWMF